VAGDPELQASRAQAGVPDLAGYWAVTVRANWRIVFRFIDGDAWDVQMIDYH